MREREANSYERVFLKAEQTLGDPFQRVSESGTIHRRLKETIPSRRGNAPLAVIRLR